MDLFYIPNFDPSAKKLHFDAEESLHITKVLRKKAGEKIIITDGKGHQIFATLTTVSSKKTTAEVNQLIHHPRIGQPLHIAIAPTKNINRLEWFLEKATEIGVQHITPLICSHSERKVIKPARLEKIILSALKQSQQFYLPTLHPIRSFESMINAYPSSFIAHCEEGAKQPFFNCIDPTLPTTILIGPEGDFSAAEIALGRKHKLIEVSLGNQRLRTETAAIVACHTFALKNESPNTH